MIISILFFLAVLIITLDSIGSKRLRGRLIKLGRAFFAASAPLEHAAKDSPPILTNFLEFSGQNTAPPTQTLRFKLKGAQKKSTAKSWHPIEAKQFQTLEPLTMSYYEDLTLGFLWSQKKSRLIQKGKAKQQQWIFSLFPYGKKQDSNNPILSWMHFLASMPWLPDIAFLETLDWEKIDGKSITAKFQMEGNTINVLYQFKSNGQPIRCRCTYQDLEAPASKLDLEYQYFTFESVESWQIPLSGIMVEKTENSEHQTKFSLTQLVYNEDFAWW